METKIQLKHPGSKQAVGMTKGKYDVLKKIIVKCLKTNGESTHTELLRTITADFKSTKRKFDGSIEWHMEWVKLDLEARNEIKRVGDKSPVKFALVK